MSPMRAEILLFCGVMTLKNPVSKGDYQSFSSDIGEEEKALTPSLGSAV